MDRKTLFLLLLQNALPKFPASWRVALKVFADIAENDENLSMIEQRTDAPVSTAVSEYLAYCFENGPKPFWFNV